MPSAPGRGPGRLASDPRAVGAALAVCVRAAVTWQQWSRNPVLANPKLDQEIYLAWARDIAGGDLLGRHGTVAGGPFLLNPLYAYVIAPFVPAAGSAPVAILVLQTLLAGATAWLAASVARRLAGPVAGWFAAIAVALSTALTHLDGHVAVSGLAAFLVAGACWSCAPAEREHERGHGPLAAGVWLGLASLARPVVVFAVPLVVLLFALRRTTGRARAAALVLAPFLACGLLSYVRNVAVSGEAVVYTAANGQNLHLGNNPAGRRVRQMFTEDFRFSPREMHEDGRYRVGWELKREPARAEISSWFAARAWDELKENPGASVVWYGHKARWFLSPQEPASSADLDFDRGFAPLLGAAFVPTWLLAAFAVSAAFVAARRREALLGAGALVVSHGIACTLSFPLEHYRSPAIPAMAVLAGCAVAAGWDGLRRGMRRPALVTLAAAGVAAAAGALPPQPAYLRENLFVNQAVADADARRFDAAERLAREALTIDPESLAAAEVLSYRFRAEGRAADARPFAEKLAARRPWHPLYRKIVAWIDAYEGRRDVALAAMDRLVAEFPWSAQVLGWRGEIRCVCGDRDGARADLSAALARGAIPEEWALKECGMR